MYVLNIFDTQAGGMSLLFIATVEVFGIGWCYGPERLRVQVSQMIGYMPGIWWNICLRYITPLILSIIFFFQCSQWKGIKYGGKAYPAWAEFIGWCIALSSILMIPFFAILNVYRAEGESLHQVGSTSVLILHSTRALLRYASASSA